MLPRWTTKESFIVFCKYINNEALGEVNITTAQRLLWLADFFKIPELESCVIKKYILLNLSKENVLDFLEDSYVKISYMNPVEEDDELCEVWNILLGESFTLAGNNLSFLSKVQKTKLLKLDNIVIDKLAECFFKTLSSQFAADNCAITEFLMEKKSIANPFDLLEDEMKRIEVKDKAILTESGMEPTLTWNLSNLNENYHRESEAFSILGYYWTLCVWSFKKEGFFHIAIKNARAGRDTEEVSMGSSYYNKRNFFFSASKKRSISQRCNESRIEKLDGIIPNHCLLTLASSIQIKELHQKNKGAFSVVSLLAGSKSPAILRSLPISKLPCTEGKLSIEIYMKMNYTYASILAYVSKNFDWLYNNPSLVKLRKAEFLILLKHKHFNVKREEDALIALCIWCIP